jgi:hypothetical protein
LEKIHTGGSNAINQLSLGNLPVLTLRFQRHNSVTINVLSRKHYSLQHAMSDIKGISTNHPFPLICLIIVWLSGAQGHSTLHKPAGGTK